MDEANDDTRKDRDVLLLVPVKVNEIFCFRCDRRYAVIDLIDRAWTSIESVDLVYCPFCGEPASFDRELWGG